MAQSEKTKPQFSRIIPISPQNMDGTSPDSLVGFPENAPAPGIVFNRLSLFLNQFGATLDVANASGLGGAAPCCKFSGEIFKNLWIVVRNGNPPRMPPPKVLGNGGVAIGKFFDRNVNFQCQPSPARGSVRDAWISWAGNCDNLNEHSEMPEEKSGNS